ncbi:MAG: MFS transporter, partial [Alphaproteobacteria bacterium]|nr:MFS transporter [Alphaproteobacteria bacterium]
ASLWSEFSSQEGTPLHVASELSHSDTGRATTPAERRRAFAILFFSLLCTGVGQSVMFAILPSLARELGLSEFAASMPFVSSATIWVFTSSLWGEKSDHWGRKPIILMGLTAFGISFGLFAAVANLGVLGFLPVAVAYPLMIATRSLYGIFGAGASPAAQAYVADRTTRRERISGVATISAAFGLGTTIGPGIGAVLVVFGLFAPYYFTALMALASAAAIWLFLPERSAPRRKFEQRATLKWHDARVWPFILYGTGIATAAAVPIQTVGYFVIDVLHVSTAAAPKFTGIGLVALSAAALFAQLVVVQRFNPSARLLMRVGGLVTIVSFLMFLLTHTFEPLVLALLVNGFGFGMVKPGYAAAASLAVDPHEQGAVAGLTGATAGAGFIFGPMIATGLYRLSPFAPYLFGALLMTACHAYALLSPRLRQAGEVMADEVEEPAETLVPEA